jgi:hypothetical protein
MPNSDANLRGHDCMLPSDYALETKLADARSAEDIREITKAHYAAQNDLAPLLSRKNHSRRDILGT